MKYKASWVVPISQPPIADGWVRVEGGRVVACGKESDADGRQEPAIDLGAVAILPGLVNSHMHLELSWMRHRVPETNDFPGWIREVISLQRSGCADADGAARALRGAIREARATGTTVFGDISNTLASVAPLIDEHVPSVVFHELIGFPRERAAGVMEDAMKRRQSLPAGTCVRYSLAAHAPYSVSPALFEAIGSWRRLAPLMPCSVHLGESAAETEFLRAGSGPWRKLLDDLGSWDSSWLPPQCDPVEYLDRLGFLDEGTLVVHGVQLGEPALARLMSTGATLVTCPRGNRLTGAGAAPVSAFYASGVPVAVGTDSLASVPDLNLFSELAELRRLAPDVAASRLLQSATLVGARALGFGTEYGSIEPGKRASLIAVEIPPGTQDVEEHLVSGIAPAAISTVQ